MRLGTPLHIQYIKNKKIKIFRKILSFEPCYFNGENIFFEKLVHTAFFMNYFFWHFRVPVTILSSNLKQKNRMTI